MPTSEEHFLSGDILEEGTEVSVADLCRMFAVEERHIVELVEEGVLGTRGTVERDRSRQDRVALSWY